MDLSEVQKAIAPGATEALKVPLSYEEFKEAALLTYIHVSIKQSDGNQSLAARKIGVTPQYISEVLSGRKSLIRLRKKKDAETK